MKYSAILVLCFCMVASPFGWPLDPDNVSHKTDRIYGCYNRDWDTVNETVSNFHPGIDLLPPVGTTFPPVRAVAGGVVKDIVPSTTGHVVVIEDLLNPGYYWCYQHLNLPSYLVGHHLEINETVSTMYDQSSSGYTHLHLQRTDYPLWDPSQQGWPGGIADPLNLLEPSNAGYWAFTELPGPFEHPWFYFLKDMPIDDWADWSSMGTAYADTLAADSLHSAVDIVKGFSVCCIGEYGTNPAEPLVDMPTRISWDCFKLNDTGYELIFSKYPIDFTGEFGSTDDWVKYKQFYFRYGWEFFDSAIASCITNCNDNCYSPSSGADAVVIDLGEECTVTSVIFERISNTYPDVSMLTDESVRTVETAALVEPSLLIEVAGSDREFCPFLEESRNSTDAVRYVRIHGASGLTEVSVYGSRGTDSGVSSVEITRSVEDEGWMFAIPLAERGEEASVKIYDISGRMIWSGHAESGSVLHWDGFTENGTAVPNGVYLL